MAKKTSNPGKDAASQQPDTMQQVRELLFGEHRREVEQRLDAAFTEIDRLRASTEAAREALDQALSQRIGRLEQHTEQRLGALEGELRETIDALGRRLDQRLDDLQTLLESELAALRKHADEQLDRLDDAKVDRRALAEWMRQLAERLDG